jgi:hypothetical protein
MPTINFVDMTNFEAFIKNNRKVSPTAKIPKDLQETYNKWFSEF